MEQLKGTGVALVTPFTSKMEVDYPALEKLVNHVIDGGVEYLVVSGTTGESATITRTEKTEILEFVKKINNGRKPIVFGIGGNNTAALVNEIRSTDLEGVTAILSASPYYNKPTQEGIYQHYKTLSEASPLPIILYNVPGRTASNLSAGTTLRLARDFRNIIAIKEASGNMEQIMQIINEKPQGFMVISGDDNLTLPMIACGGEGVISVSGQGFPKVFTKMVRDALAGDFEAARKGHYRLFEATRMLFAEGNPGGIKAALKLRGIGEEYMRQPLWPVSDALREELAKEIEQGGLL